MVGLEVWSEVQIPTGLDCGTQLGDHIFGTSLDLPGFILTASALPPTPRQIDDLGILTSYVRKTEFVRARSGP